MVGLIFFLSIPIPGSVSSDRVANSDHRRGISNKINLGFDSIFKEIIIYRSFTYAFTLILRIL